MTQPGFGTKAAEKLKTAAGGFTRVAPLEVGVNAIERGITRRSRRVVAPGWVGGVLPVRMLAQRLVDRGSRRGLDAALQVARDENAPLTTPQPPSL